MPCQCHFQLELFLGVPDLDRFIGRASGKEPENHPTQSSQSLLLLWIFWLTLCPGSIHIEECNRCGPAIWRVVRRWRVPMCYSTFSIHNKIPFRQQEKTRVSTEREQTCWLFYLVVDCHQHGAIGSNTHGSQRYTFFRYLGNNRDEIYLVSNDAYQLMSARMRR